MIARLFLPLALATPFVAGCGDAEAPSNPKNPQVVLKTDMGTIRIELYEDKAPISTKNFLDYVDAKYYDGLVFHRVIKDFMIQGGGFKPDMQREQPSNDPIKNEANNRISNKRGTIAMARTDDPDSATSQFFINVVDNGSKLDRNLSNDGYAVFGKVLAGMSVVDKIREVPTGRKGGHGDVPLQPVVIESIRRVEK